MTAVANPLPVEAREHPALQPMMRVDVYRNLHRRCWSVRDTRTRLVIAHVDCIDLENPVFKVSEAGRQRVLRERRKNVHAVVRGTISGASGDLDGMVQVGYNPYKSPSFMQYTSDGDKPVGSGSFATLTDGDLWVKDPVSVMPGSG